jgi:hypothetical protein
VQVGAYKKIILQGEKIAMYPSSNFYFYGIIIQNSVGYLCIYNFYKSFFLDSSIETRIPFWGILVAMILNIVRWRFYRHTPQRVKSTLFVMFFIFGWLCAALVLAGKKSSDTFFNVGLYVYCLLGLPAFAYWIWFKYRDDRVAFLWYLAGIWFILLCAFVSTSRRILMFFSAMVAFWAMDILKKRIREGTYIKPGGKGASRDYSGALTSGVTILFVAIGAITFLPPKNQAPLGIPNIVALYLIVSSYFASEYVLYTLNDCDLLKIE